MTAALLQTDDTTGRPWLSFPRPPPDVIRRSLIARGWRYHGGHRAWHHDNPAAAIPPGFGVRSGPFVVELIAQLERRKCRGYLGADGTLVPLARARTFASEREAADVAGETTADGNGLVAAFVRPRTL